MLEIFEPWACRLAARRLKLMDEALRCFATCAAAAPADTGAHLQVPQTCFCLVAQSLPAI